MNDVGTLVLVFFSFFFCVCVFASEVVSLSRRVKKYQKSLRSRQLDTFYVGLTVLGRTTWRNSATVRELDQQSNNRLPSLRGEKTYQKTTLPTSSCGCPRPGQCLFLLVSTRCSPHARGGRSWAGGREAVVCGPGAGGPACCCPT